MHFPIIVLGKEYWRDVAELMQKMVAASTASAEDLELIHFTDSDEAMGIVRTRVIEGFGFKLIRKQPWKILLERSLGPSHRAKPHFAR